MKTTSTFDQSHGIRMNTWLWMFTIILLLGGCGGSSGGGGGGSGSAGSQTIGASGGTVSNPEGAKVVIPAGALASDVNIAITQSGEGAPALTSGLTSVGKMYAFTPHGTTFAQPVTITVPFDSAQMPAGSTPGILKTNAQGNWEELNGVTAGTDTLTAQVSSFSYGVGSFHTPSSGNGGTAFVTFHLANPQDGNGVLAVSSYAYEQISSTRTRVTLNGKVGGVQAALEVTFDKDTGANPMIVYHWGGANGTLNYAYCTGGATPCNGVAIVINGHNGRVTFNETTLNTAGNSIPRATIQNGSSIDFYWH